MEALIISCTCGTSMRTEARHFGRTTACPSCGRALVISSESVISSGEYGLDDEDGLRSTHEAEDLLDVAWNVGEVILDNYEVKEVLGRGGFGIVTRVYHRGWKLDLAVKSPHSDHFGDSDAIVNFERECQTWTNLGLHPHIVGCYYVRRLGGIPRVFAEYVAGGSLRDWIADQELHQLYAGGPDRALARILDVAIQVAWGLQYAHAQGIIHQDVKPSNVMMTPEGVAKVTDFGLANALSYTKDTSRLDVGGTILASYGGMTPAYCSPEQAENAARWEAGILRRNWPKLTRRTDIYSWAVSVFEMFNGGVTWRAVTEVKELIKSKLSDRSEGDSLPPMPASLADLLSSCLEEKPENRPADMAKVAELVKEIYEKATGKVYSREEPDPSEGTADTLNNRAASLLDLGRNEEAVRWLDKARKAEPTHPETVFNRGLLLYRSGDLGLFDWIAQLDEVEESQQYGWRPSYLRGLAYVEDGRNDLAMRELGHALHILVEEENETEKATVEAVLNGLSGAAGETSLKLVQRIDHASHEERVNAVTFSQDGSLAVSASGDATLRIWDVSSGMCIRVLEGHVGEVSDACLTSDGKYAVSGGQDGSIRIWRISDGHSLTIDASRFHEVVSVGISESDEYLLVARRGLLVSDEKGFYDLKTPEQDALEVTKWKHIPPFELVIWDMPPKRIVTSIPVLTENVTAACFSSDGRYALCGRVDVLRLYELSSGKCVRSLGSQLGQIKALCFSQDAEYALSGSSHGINLWQVSSGKRVRMFSQYPAGCHCLEFSPDGLWFLCGTTDGKLGLQKLAHFASESKTVGHLQGAPVSAVCFSRSGDLAISGHEEGTVSLWEVESGNLVWAMRRDGKSIGSQRLQRTGQVGVSFVVLRPQSALELRDFSSRFARLLQKARLHLKRNSTREAAKAIASARNVEGRNHSTAALELWHEAGRRGSRTGLRSAWVLKILEGHRGSANSVAFSPDGRLLLSGGGSGHLTDWESESALHLWEVESGELIQTFQGHTRSVRQVRFSPDGLFALSVGDDRTVRIWDLDGSVAVTTFEPHGEGELCADFSPDGRFALSGGRDGSVRFWDVFTGKRLHTFRTLGAVSDVAVSPDGRYGLVACDFTLGLLDLGQWKWIRVFERHVGGTTSVCLSPDGKNAISGNQRNELKLWSVDTGECIRSFSGQTSGVGSLAFSPDGKFGLSTEAESASEEYAARMRVWDIPTGQCLRTFEGKDCVSAAVFCPDGRYIASASEDGSIVLWELDWEYEFPDPCDWDDDALPYLENFLALLPTQRSRLGRKTPVSWSEPDFEKLLETLRNAGYGWLRPEGVRRKLEALSKT